MLLIYSHLWLLKSYLPWLDSEKTRKEYNIKISTFCNSTLLDGFKTWEWLKEEFKINIKMLKYLHSGLFAAPVLELVTNLYFLVQLMWHPSKSYQESARIVTWWTSDPTWFIELLIVSADDRMQDGWTVVGSAEWTALVVLMTDGDTRSEIIFSGNVLSSKHDDASDSKLFKAFR